MRRSFRAYVNRLVTPRCALDKNSVGGWCASRDATVEAVMLARNLGVRFLAAEADALLHNDDGTDVVGVKAVDGRSFTADVVVLACGSWTPRLLPELATNCLPTGQVVATVQLDAEETKRYQDVPVRTVCLALASRADTWLA